METRNQSIYRERVLEKRTLQAIANKYAISRERVRQIVREMGERQEINFPETPVLVRDIPWTQRAYNCLYNDNLTPMPIAEFVEYTKHKDIRRIPNLGRVTAREIQFKINNLGYEIDLFNGN